MNLRSATLLFLALPYLPFLAGWIRAPLAAALGAACAIGLAFHLRAEAGSASRPMRPEPREALRALLPTVLVFVLTGVGGWGYQDADWLRGNAVFRDLVTRSWPVVYDVGSEPLLLVYYIAFYLPAAAVGQMLGWQAANLALFLYGLFGACLASLWVTRLVGARSWWVVPVFLAFSGMDAIGTGLRSLFEYAIGDPEPRSWRYLEWWVGYGVACLPSNLNLLVFAPNQALPGWCLTALVIDAARDRRTLSTAALWPGLGALWAPFVCIGLAPFVALLALREARSGRRLAALLSGANVAGVLLGLVAAGYYAARLHPYTLPIDVSGLYHEGFTLTLFRRGPAFLFLYPIFVVLEFGLLHALLYAAWWRDRSLFDATLGALLITSTVALCILPWLNLGWNNDLVMRASIPMLFVTALATLRVLDVCGRGRDASERRLARAIAVVLAIGAVNTAVIAGRHVVGIWEQGALVAVPDEERVMDLFELQRERYMGIGFNFVGQYLGSPESPIARHLLAPAQPR